MSEKYINQPYDGGVIVLDCNISKAYSQSNKGGPNHYEASVLSTVRPMAPFALHDVCTKLGIHSTVINYVDRWDTEELAELLCNWCDHHNLNNIMLACSAQFTSDKIVTNPAFRDLILEMKSKYNVTLIIGGPIASAKSNEWDGLKPDVVFQGRSLHLFEDYLKGEISEQHVEDINGITSCKNHVTGVVREQPLVPTLYDDYCLNEKDIVQFEIRLGCKFNCTFCNFEFRGAKKVHDTETATLSKMFTDAQGKYNVTRFAAADDTVNEEESKVDLLVSATEHLSYKPKIVGFMRFDVMMAHPHTAEKLDRAGFIGPYFGIETFHPVAGKHIRKKVNRERGLNFLEFLTTQYPHWWVNSGYIIGLPGEPLKHNWSVLKEIRKRKLLDGIIPAALSIWQISGWTENESEMVKNPGKFGLTLTDKLTEDHEHPGLHFIHWHHEHADYNTAVLYRNKSAPMLAKGGITLLSPWEILMRDAIGGPDLFNVEEKNKWKQMVSEEYQGSFSRGKDINDLAILFYKEYMERKKEYYRKLFAGNAS
jgi:lipoate synthase